MEGVSIVWAEGHAGSFEKLKQALCQAPVLQIPDFGKDIVLTTDASDVAITVVLQQRLDGDLHPYCTMVKFILLSRGNTARMRKSVFCPFRLREVSHLP